MIDEKALEAARLKLCEGIGKDSAIYCYKWLAEEVIQAYLANTRNQFSINDITKILNNHQMFYQVAPIAAREIYDLIYKTSEEK